jgi:hypothetical protein
MHDLDVPSSERIPPGWLPIGFAAEQAVIRWLMVGAATLSEPMYQNTVDALRGSVFAPPEIETELSVLRYGASRLPAAVPAGLILHMSRCGSTLLLNALKKADDVVGLGEVDPLDQALVRSSSRSKYWAEIFGDLLEPLIAVFANYQGTGARQVVVKFGPCGILELRAIRVVWPRVPCIVLIRTPIEVLVSNLRSPPRWMRYWYEDPKSHWIGYPPREVLASDAANCCAWMLGRCCSEALSALDDGCAVIDYGDLCPATVRYVAAYFGLKFSLEAERRASETFGVHCKFPTRAYEDDSAAKQRLATPSIRAVADRWVTASYQELRQRARQDLSKLRRRCECSEEGAVVP